MKLSPRPWHFGSPGEISKMGPITMWMEKHHANIEKELYGMNFEDGSYHNKEGTHRMKNVYNKKEMDII